jgi:hypothetical protein
LGAYFGDAGGVRFSGKNVVIPGRAKREPGIHNHRARSQRPAPPAKRLEALTGNRRGQHSIRINVQWRICFTWTEEGPADVEIVDYH